MRKQRHERRVQTEKSATLAHWVTWLKAATVAASRCCNATLELDGRHGDSDGPTGLMMTRITVLRVDEAVVGKGGAPYPGIPFRSVQQGRSKIEKRW